MRWPWQPREYVAVLAALHEAEAALEEREREARAQRAAQAEVLEAQAEVAQEITRRRRRTR